MNFKIKKIQLLVITHQVMLLKTFHLFFYLKKSNIQETVPLNNATFSSFIGKQSEWCRPCQLFKNDRKDKHYIKKHK